MYTCVGFSDHIIQSVGVLFDHYVLTDRIRHIHKNTNHSIRKKDDYGSSVAFPRSEEMLYAQREESVHIQTVHRIQL